MSNKAIIQVQNLSKKFKIGRKSGDLRQTFQNMLSFSKQDSLEIWALKDINFEVNQGEVFGIIGPNGSGKSTLLKILSKITYPTSGKAILNGKVSSLLEVGTGFHPELTGRENIFLNGSILGMKRAEIKKKFDEIVDFSGVEQFIDTPVKHYSSGMYVRLAFSVAAHLEPEILLVDEVLSVGDMAFRQKSMGKMNEVAQSGRTVLFVSHNLNAVKSLCNNGLYLESGQILTLGNINNVIDNYKNNYNSTENRNNKIKKISEIDLDKFVIINSENTETSFISAGDNIKFLINLHSTKIFNNVQIRIEFIDSENNMLFVCNNIILNKIINIVKGNNNFICELKKIPLNIGNYKINIFIVSAKFYLYSHFSIYTFEITSGRFYESGNLPFKDKKFLVEHRW